MNVQRFRNRSDAGRQLASRLVRYLNRPDVIVLGLPRGGVPVAVEVARALNAPLDVFLVRKLGVPGLEELAMGALASGGVQVLNHEVVQTLGISTDTINQVAAKEMEELERRELAYRGNRPMPVLRGKTIILVDDGLATGATMHAAVKALYQQHPAAIIVAVPVTSVQTCENMRLVVDDIVGAIVSDEMTAVSMAYDDFAQTTDEDVTTILAQWARDHSSQRATASPDESDLTVST